ncbi:TPA: GNAT family N-acetyltransferase, partial [Stenotrophomonas maltophilia]|nr:GNAT family N-acetyltransferase [Stenotrophomonas maltophilia]
LARDDPARARVLSALRGALPTLGVSSAHINFHTAADEALFGDDWLLREDIQFQWQNPGDWTTFDQFLGAMDHKHRKNIRQERARVTRQGIGFRVVHGDEASRADLQAMYRFYLQTFVEYGNAPALTEPFLRHLASSLGRGLVMFLAEQDGEPIAGALCLRGGDTLYGRYWGGATLPGLHFEACYYQGIEYCLREGLTRFEPGAQGEHKLARGFLPTRVRSRHWVADADFAEALQDWCRQERRDVRRYEQTLQQHSPFRTQD